MTRARFPYHLKMGSTAERTAVRGYANTDRCAGRAKKAAAAMSLPPFHGGTKGGSGLALSSPGEEAFQKAEDGGREQLGMIDVGGALDDLRLRGIRMNVGGQRA